MKPLNQVVTSTPPSGIRRFFDIANELEDVISLSIGEPDFITPWTIREAAVFSLERGITSYTSNAGLPALREAICAHLFGRYGVRYDSAHEALVTVGVSEALDLSLRALLNPGDEVLFAEPCYVSYLPGIRFAGGVPVPVRSRGEESFRLRAEDVEAAITPQTKAILLCYPSNPTGAVQTREDLQRIVDLAVKHDLYLISDEIYDRLVYGCEHVCVASLEGAWERTITLNGFSKAYAMTGWRIGYACAPRPILENLAKIHQYTMLCASHTAQIGAIEALTQGEPDVREMVADYDQRRRLLVHGLNGIGLDCPDPAGAFYAFPSVQRTGLTSQEFAEALLYEERVAVVPGDAFGESGSGYVRCCYATATNLLEEALVRMGRFMEKRGVHRGVAEGIAG